MTMRIKLNLAGFSYQYAFFKVSRRTRTVHFTWQRDTFWRINRGWFIPQRSSFPFWFQSRFRQHDSSIFQNIVSYNSNMQIYSTITFSATFITFSTDWYIKYPSVRQEGDHFRPFHPILWITICLTIIVCSLTIILLAYTNKVFRLKRQTFSYVDYAFIAFDCFVNQGMFRFLVIY